MRLPHLKAWLKSIVQSRAIFSPYHNRNHLYLVPTLLLVLFWWKTKCIKWLAKQCSYPLTAKLTAPCGLQPNMVFKHRIRCHCHSAAQHFISAAVDTRLHLERPNVQLWQSVLNFSVSTQMGVHAYELHESVEPSGSQSQRSGITGKEEECLNTVLWLVSGMTIQILKIKY